MEKIKQARITELKNTERINDIYRQACLELEVGDRIKLSRFDNFKVDWRQVEEEKTFESFHDLNDEEEQGSFIKKALPRYKQSGIIVTEKEGMYELNKPVNYRCIPRP